MPHFGVSKPAKIVLGLLVLQGIGLFGSLNVSPLVAAGCSASNPPSSKFINSMFPTIASR